MYAYTEPQIKFAVQEISAVFCALMFKWIICGKETNTEPTTSSELDNITDRLQKKDSDSNKIAGK